MPDRSRFFRTRLVPGLLSGGMLAVLGMAAATPIRSISATTSSSCPYGDCVSPQPIPFFETMMGELLIGLLIVAIAVTIVALFKSGILRGRGKPGAAERAAPPAGGAGEVPTEAQAPTSEEPAAEAPPEPQWEEGTPPAEPAPSGPTDDIDALMRELHEIGGNNK